jgi:glycosyltransferase involved in cell wall biosynthesis
MTDPTFTILMPIVRPPVLMPFAIQSILNQTRGDFELFIVCDGAPAETVKAANEAADRDRRIRAFSFPKGERRGEAHRHTALQEARGRFVCQLADDDLWLPDHLQEMAVLLSEFEFGNLLHTSIRADAGPSILLGDLADPAIRARMTSDGEVFNMFGPSQSGYRMDTYRRLPLGWSPAPAGFPTDLAMWRKFLALPGIAAGTRFVLTSVHFGDAARQGWSLQQRREEIASYAEMILQPEGRDRLRQLSFRGAARLAGAKNADVAKLRRDINVYLAGIATMQTQLDAAGEAIATKDAYIAKLHRDIDVYLKGFADLQAQIAAASDALATKDAYIAKLHHDIEIMNPYIAKLHADIGVMNPYIAKLHADIKIYVDGIASLEAQMARLTTATQKRHNVA